MSRSSIKGEALTNSHLTLYAGIPPDNLLGIIELRPFLMSSDSQALFKINFIRLFFRTETMGTITFILRYADTLSNEG